MTVKTTFAGKNPYAKPFSVEDLVICKDPVPATKIITKYKYDAIFKQLKVGEALKCPGDKADTVASALRSYIKRNSLKHVVRATPQYQKEEPAGRVWML